MLLNVNTSSDVQILNFIHLILLWFRILGRSMRQGQEATSVGEIPGQVEREHTERLHQALQRIGRRLLVRRGPVWVGVLLRE